MQSQPRVPGERYLHNSHNQQQQKSPERLVGGCSGDSLGLLLPSAIRSIGFLPSSSAF